ncbi:MAG: MATE family efflux transporter [Treponemataceae bacterium]|nr:MATE family efflux transporter [Treponemataceae bacterium]
MTEGNPFKLIFFFSIPVLLGNLFQNFYSMADSIIVGRLLGTNALAAVGNTGPMNFLIIGFICGLTSGFAVITAQAFGAKNKEELKRSVAMNIMLNVFFGILFTALALLTNKPILKLINTPTEIIDDSKLYLDIIYSGLFATILYNATSCILRAVGDSKTPLYFLILSSILNIILDIILIKYTTLGVAAAALATVIAQLVSGTLCVIFIIKKYPELHVKKEHFEWCTSFASRHLKIGAPMAFQFSITAIGVIVLQGALNKFGPNVIAAYTAANKVEQLIAVAAGSFGVVMANYAGQNYGAKRIDRIRAGTTAGTILTLGFSVISMLIAFIFPEPLTSLFVEAGSAEYAEVLQYSKEYLFVTAIFYPPLFLIFIYRNVLQSIGKTFMPLMGGFFELIARSVCAFTLPLLWGYAGICLAGPVAWLSAAIPLLISYMVIIRRLQKDL